MNHFALRPRHGILWFASGLILLQSIVPMGSVRADGLAGVSGGTVVAGQAAITQDASTLNVNTMTDRTIINWNGFSIGAGETANFIQPGANSAVLNRVTTQNNPSAIFGAMNSNGNVILINPSGIVVGPGGVINTNGFTASVLDIPNNEFLKGGVLNFRGDSTASVINEGTIKTGTGGAALIGGNVINNGSITSEGGSISLATGGSVTLTDGSRFTHADMATIESGISPTAGLIQNSGTIRATGALETGGEVYLVNPGGKIMHDGTIAANKGASGGSVDIAANKGGTATVAGVIDASGNVGGRVVVQADHVALQGADIDVSGIHGGGKANIGGGRQGNDASITNAKTTTVDAGSVIRADAIQLGDGGEVILWADDQTVFGGTLSARGGALGGDGGFIETSGPYLELSGRVDLAAGRTGASGTWLIDPVNVSVDAAFIATILPTLEQGSDVIITTAAAGADLGDITFVDPLTVDFANDPSSDDEATLTALADNNIVQSAAITAQNGVLNLDFQAGTSITVDASIATNHGDIAFIADDIAITGLGGINANTGGVTIQRASLGNVMLGATTGIGGLHLDQAELATIDAATLVIGGDAGANNIINLTVNSADATTGTIAGDVVLNVLGSGSSQITFAGNNAFNGLIVRSNKAISFDDFSTDTTTTVNGSAVLHADFDGVGSGIEDIFFFGNNAGGSHRLDVGGDLLMVLGPDNQGVSLADAGGIDVAGALTIELSREGSLGVGSSTGSVGSDFRLSQAELDVMSAAVLNLGAPLEADSNTTEINVGAIDLTAFDLVNMSAFDGASINGASINYAGFNSFVALNAVDGTDINVLTGATVSATTSINFDAPVVNLDGALDAPTTTGTATTVNVIGSAGGAKIQDAVDVAASGAMINVGAGTFVDPSQVVIGKDLTIDGAGQGITLFSPGFDTSSSGDARGWWLINPGAAVDLSDFTMDGAGQLVFQAIRHRGSGNINSLSFNDIQFNASGPDYAGTAIAAFGDGPVNVSDSTFTNIGRVGTLYFGNGVSGSTFSGNQYTGKGDGDFLDYGLEVGAGAANIVATDNRFSDSRGVASVDGTQSAGVLLSTFFGAGTSAIFQDNVFTDNTNGLTVGFGQTDSSAVEMRSGNRFIGGVNGIVISGAGTEVVGNTIRNTVFNGQSGDYIQLSGGALFNPGQPTIIDATGASFDGLDLSLTANVLAVQDKILHYLDDPTLGLVDIGALGVNDGDSIQLAVNAAGFLSGPQTVAVGSGTFGGSVEVWVDDLTLLGQGATTIIDTDAVDAFANNGDRNTGFELTASSSDAGGSFFDRLVVDGVTIDGFSFLGTNSGTTGVLLGEGFRQARNTTIQNSRFNRLLDGIVGRNINENTTIRDVRMRRIASQGIDIRNPLGGNAVILIEDSNLVSEGEAVRFLGSLNGSQVTIRGNRLTSEGADAIRFASPIGLSNVLIGGPNGSDANRIRGNDEGIDVESNIILSLFAIEGNRLVEGGDDSIAVDGAIILSRFAVVNNRNIIGGEDGINVNQILASQVAIAGNRSVRGTVGSGIEFDGLIDFSSMVDVIANEAIVGGDYGIEFDTEIDRSTVRIARNDRLRGRQIAGISFRDRVGDSEVSIINNDRIRGGDHGVEFESVEDSSVRIARNGDIVGDLISGVGFFGDVLNSDVRLIRNVRVEGADHGVLFDSPVINSHIAVNRNDRLIGDGEAGVAFLQEVENSRVRIRNNGVSSNDADGILFDGVVVDSSIQVNQNTVSSAAEAIQFADDVIGSNVKVRNNAIRSGGAGIAFSDRDSLDPTITDSIVVIAKNTIDGNGQDLPDFGMIFEGIDGNSTVTVRKNTIVDAEQDGVLVQDFVADNAFLDLFMNKIGSDGNPVGNNGIDIDRLASSRGVRIFKNEIYGGDDAIEFDDRIINSKVEVIDNRLVGVRGDGVAFGARIQGNSIVDLTGNTITAEQHGISTESVRNRSKLSLIDNLIEITGDGNGMLLRNLDSREAVLVLGGSTTGGAVGLKVLQTGGAARSGAIIVDGLVVNQASDTGIEFKTQGDNKTLEVTLLNAVTVNGGASPMEVAMVFDGPGLSLTGDTLGDTRFVGNTGNFIELRNGGLFEPGRPTLIDGTGVYWDGLEAGFDAQRQQIIDRIIDFLDDQTLGLIFPGAGLADDQTYDRFTRYQDYFRTYGALMGPFPVGTITYRTPTIDVAESLEDQADRESVDGETSAADRQSAEKPVESKGIDLVSH